MTVHHDHALADERHADRYRSARPRPEYADGDARIGRTAPRTVRAVTSVRRGLGVLLLEAGLHLIATADRGASARSHGFYSVDHQASNSA